MKKIIPRLSLFVLVLGFLSLSISIVQSQSEPEAADGLLFELQSDTSRTVFVKKGQELQVWTYDGEKHDGTLRSVSDSSFVLGTEEIAFAKAQRVKSDRGEGSRIGGIAAIIFGFVGALLGLLFGFLGALAIKDADGSADGCAQVAFGFFLICLGVVLGAGALIVLIIGIVAYAVGNVVARSFALDGKWKMRRSRKP